MLTSPPTKFKSLVLDRRGLTLIEIMVVLAIIAAVVTIGVPKLVSQGTQIRNTLRTMGVVSRRLHHQSQLQKKTYRIAIQLGEGEENAFWVESADKSTMLQTEEQEEEQKEKDEDKDETEEKKSAFQLDQSIIKKPIILPSGIVFEDVELPSRNSVITSGRAYIHYLPQGYVEEAAIHITNKKEMRWTILIHPLTGQSEMVGKYLSLKDLRKKQQ
jgi:general secretion pathway protein H